MRDTSYVRKLVDYLKRNVSKGYTMESLKWALIDQGYSRSEVSKAIEEANKELSKEAPILKEKPVIKYEAVKPNEGRTELKEKKGFWRRLFG